MMTDEEIIAVVQAHKEGKKIQWSYQEHNDWHDLKCSIEWAKFNFINYRVAPEPRKPREWWVYIKDGEIKSCLTRDFEAAISTPILVREIIE